jgi:ankyrin repeat protein
MSAAEEHVASDDIDMSTELLFRYAKTGAVEEFRDLLFSKRVRLSVQDALGNTPLHYAAAGNHPRCVHFILRTDPKVINITNNIGDTALHKVTNLMTEFLSSFLTTCFFRLLLELMKKQSLFS